MPSHRSILPLALAAALELALRPSGAGATTGATTRLAVDGAAAASAAAARPEAPGPTDALRADAAANVAEEVALGLGGSHQVTPSGGFAYRVPIELPRWRGGVQPALALAYDSQARAGLAGVGTALTGLPAIVRVPDLDGLSFGTGSDRFAITWGGWGQPAAPGGLLVEDVTRPGSYRTVVESWHRFEPLGDCGRGPCLWRVTRPDGTVLTFGGKADATLPERAGGGHGVRGVRAWSLAHVRDLDGNSYGVTYEEDEAMAYPVRIDEGCVMSSGALTPWQRPAGQIPDDPAPYLDPAPLPPGDLGGFTLDPDAPSLASFDPWRPVPVPDVGTSQLPDQTGVTLVEPAAPIVCSGPRSVSFRYDLVRPGPAPLPDRYARLLTAIDVNGASGRLYTYELAYRPSPITGVKLLDTITKVGATPPSGQPPRLPPTTFTWSTTPTWRSQTGPAAFATRVGWAPTTADVRSDTLPGDVNGDGRDDLVRVDFGRDTVGARVALGQGGPEPLGPVSAPIALPIGQTSVTADWRMWRAALADLDVDGRKDLVLVLAHRGQGRVLIAPGRDGGLGPFVDLGFHAQLDAATHPLVTSGWQRVVVGDVNGDQADDLLIVDLPMHHVTVLVGRAGGAGAPIERFGSPGSAYYAHAEPLLTDLDGDGVLDLVLTENRAAATDGSYGPGARLYLFFGSRRQSLASGLTITLASTAEIGTTLYQMMAGDLDGDGVADLIHAYTGPADPPGEDRRRPYGRDVRALFGDWSYEDPRIVQRTWPALVADPAAQPSYRLDQGELAAWEQHTGDLDGDGCADLVGHYAGARGELVDVSLGDCHGGFRPRVRHTLAASRPDGPLATHRVHARVFDLDQDGRADLVRWYAGAAGQWIEVAFGGADGLAPTTPGRFRRLLSEDAATGGIVEPLDPADGTSAAAVQLFAADVDGDGRRDLVLATPARTPGAPARTRIALAPSAPGTTGPDQVTRIANGFGGTVDVETTTPIAAGAIERAAPCAAAAAADCGLPATVARPLVARVTVRDGRPGTPARSTAYRYRDGRYYPGYGARVDAPATPRGERAELGFAATIATDEQLGVVTTTTYRQDRPFERQVARVEVAAPIAHGWQSFPGAVLRRVTTWDHEVATTLGGPDGRARSTIVRPTRVVDETLELGQGARLVTRDLRYGPYGAVTGEVECAAGACVETRTAHVHDPSRWVVNRPTAVSRVRAEPAVELVLSWETRRYTGDHLTAVRALVCADSMRCGCEADAETCVADGRARWITTASDHHYDATGNLTHVVDATGAATDTAWDATGASPETVTRWVTRDGAPVALAQTTRYDGAGRPREEIDAAGRLTTHHYDGLGRRDRVDRPDGSWETWAYPDAGNVALQAIRHERSLDAARSAVDLAYYDGLGRVVRTLSPGPLPGTQIERRTEAAIRADAGGVPLLRQRTSEPRFATGADPVALWTEVTYEPLGQAIRATRVRGTATTTSQSWDLERVLRIGGRTSMARARAALAADGSLAGTPEWLTESRDTDARGRVVAIDGEHATRTDYLYDDALRLQRIVGPYTGQPGAQYSAWSYDSLGRITIEDDSARGARYLAYDDLGHPSERTDDLGRTVTWQYDALGRPTLEDGPEGVTTWTYDDPAIPGGAGRLAEVSGPWGTDRVVAYDGLGRIAARDRTIGALPRQRVGLAYDHVGRVVGKTLPDGTAMTWRYDLAGDLTAVEVGGLSYLAQSSFDAHGAPRARTSRTSDVTLDVDALGHLRGLRARDALTGAEQVALDYAYDSAGNVTAVTDARSTTVVGGIDTRASASYRHDRLNRLIEATDAGGTTAYVHAPDGDLARRGALELIESSHRLDVQVAGRYSPCAAPPAGQPLPPGCTYTPPQPLYQLHYDDAGNVERRHGGWPGAAGNDTLYRYDAHDRLIGFEAPGGVRAAMQYDDTGARVSRSEADAAGETTTYTIDPAYDVRVRGGDLRGPVATVHVSAPGVGVIASITAVALPGTGSLLDALVENAQSLHGSPIAGLRKGTIHYLVDHLGTPRLIVDGIGRPLTRYAYDAFGDRVPARSTGVDLSDVGFTGQRRDASSELIYYGARYYDPIAGRFLTADSVLPGGGADPRGLNRYAYAFGNPVTYTDPSGHAPSGPWPTPGNLIPPSLYPLAVLGAFIEDIKGTYGFLGITWGIDTERPGADRFSPSLGGGYEGEWLTLLGHRDDTGWWVGSLVGHGAAFEAGPVAAATLWGRETIVDLDTGVCETEHLRLWEASVEVWSQPGQSGGVSREVSVGAGFWHDQDDATKAGAYVFGAGSLAKELHVPLLGEVGLKVGATVGLGFEGEFQRTAGMVLEPLGL